MRFRARVRLSGKARKAETHQRRIDKAVSKLREDRSEG